MVTDVALDLSPSSVVMEWNLLPHEAVDATSSVNCKLAQEPSGQVLGKEA